MRNDECGSAVLETVVAFVPFVLIMAGIVMLVNVVTMEAKVHYALTQTAEEISILTYSNEIGDKTDRVEARKTLQGFLDMMGRVFLQDLIPSQQVDMMFLNHWDADDINALFEKYMWNGNEKTGKKQLGLIQGFDRFDFSKASVADGVVDLVVEYNINFTFTTVKPMFSLKITQTAATKAWSNGNGKDLAFWRAR